jgi:hypothetical protein
LIRRQRAECLRHIGNSEAAGRAANFLPLKYREDIEMNAVSDASVHWDPYDPKYFANPYPAFRRLREEAPLYYNEQYDFYAVSRFEDVAGGLGDRGTYISGRGGILEVIKQNVPIPPGVFIFEDPVPSRSNYLPPNMIDASMAPVITPLAKPWSV